MAPNSPPPKGTAAPPIIMQINSRLFQHVTLLPGQHEPAQSEDNDLTDLLRCLSPQVNQPRSLNVKPRKRPKVTIHVVRHGQALHNVRTNPERTQILDPDLTPRGINQCVYLKENFPHMDKITICLISPLRRTIDTALKGFEPIFKRGIKGILWNDLREFGRSPSNTGTKLDKLKEQVKDSPLDLQLLFDGWHLPPLYEYDPPELRQEDRQERVERVKKELEELKCAVLNGGWWMGMYFERHQGPENVEILVVSHGAFLTQLIGKDIKTDGQQFSNAEWKSFKFPSANKIAAGYNPLDLIEKKSS